MSNSVKIIAPFEATYAGPIDARSICNTIADRNAITTLYEGLEVFVVEHKAFYKYVNSAWGLSSSTIISTSGVPSPSVGTIGDLAISDAGVIYYKEIKTGDTSATWSVKSVIGTGTGESGSVTMVDRTYDSVSAMNADLINVGDNCIAIISTDINNEDNGKLYKKVTESGTSFWKPLARIAGPQGPSGTNGTSATVQIGTVTTGEPGTDVVVTNIGTESDVVLDITIPRGQVGATGAKGDIGLQGIQGEKGETGTAATVQIGTVSTGEPGTDVVVTNIGTESAVVLDITIPRGYQGPQGEQGIQGLQGIQGPQGETGSSSTIQIGTVTVGSSSSDVAVNNSGTASAAVLDFTIPLGPKGDKGDTGADGGIGPAPTILIGDIISVAYEESASATILSTETPGVYTLNLSIPYGAIGPKGDKGDTGVGIPEGGNYGQIPMNNGDGTIVWTDSAGMTIEEF